MSYLTDRLHADLDAHQALDYPPEYVLIATDDLAALLHELGTVQAQWFDAEGDVSRLAALVRHVDGEPKRYRRAWYPQEAVTAGLHNHGCGCTIGGDGGRCPECGCCVHCSETCVDECPIITGPKGTYCPTPSCGCWGRSPS